MYGSFNELAQEVWDFTRCQRPNGTFYGTAGKCKSGDAVGAKEKAEAKPKKTKAAAALEKATPEQLEKLKSHPKVTPAQKAKLDKAIAEKKAVPKESAKTNDERIKSLKAEAEKLKSAFQKHQEKGEWDKADEVIKKATAINQEISSLSGASEKKPKAKKANAQDLEQRQAEMKRRHGEYREGQNKAKLNEKQKTALRDYTEEDGRRPYFVLNGCLRQPATCKPKNKGWTSQHAKEIDSALKKLPANDKGEPFWRGMNADSGQAAALYKALEKAKPGVRFKDPGFGSYTYDESVARSFTSRQVPSIVFVSRSKQLRPIDEYSSLQAEREAILPRNTEQTVRSITKDGNKLIVEVD